MHADTIGNLNTFVVCEYIENLIRDYTRAMAPGHHVFECRAVLGVVHALRVAFVPLRPPRPARPSGMDNASAQRTILALTWRPGTCLRHYNVVAPMSNRVTYQDGVFVPLEEVKRLRPGQLCTVFSDEELAEIRLTLGG